MFLIGKECLSCVPRATLPKSWTVLFMKSLSAQAVGCWALVRPALSTQTANAKANFLMPLLPSSDATARPACRDGSGILAAGTGIEKAGLRWVRPLDSPLCANQSRDVNML